MAFIDTILKPPAYGWADEQGQLVKTNCGNCFRFFPASTCSNEKKLAGHAFVAVVAAVDPVSLFVYIQVLYVAAAFNRLCI